ncbi:MBL fold metallo-hydrolase [Chelatococcus reniformis]|uniref:MBL fold metallo-hydrolase n=1 Tax=Chelatococcus reniformis TaxID=1494448 RepID=A0A916UMS5_9HYPH|nr:MBL fold metallo-hydrolase [Chelatococcus reniformis]GGC79676.1 MBL fold metallo-hydrolase [Chelatococcus reniformis]
MSILLNEPLLKFPIAVAPEPGVPLEVAPGVLWVRFQLPFRLNHVNVYLIDDGNGWAVLDAGIANDATRQVWEALVSGPLAGRPLTRLIVTHHHPDHIGLAGWLSERFGLKLLMSQTEYLEGQNIALNPGAMETGPYRQFYVEHGLDETTTKVVLKQGHGYLRMVTPLPPTFRRLVGGDRIKIGGRRFEVLSGGGHSPEQIMLYAPDDNFFLGADQVMAKITPNVSVWAVDPEGDPLGLYRRSLKELKAHIPNGTLVLPGHNLPFYGLHERADALEEHHVQRCDLILSACGAKPHSVAELVPVMFPRVLDPHQMSFAFSEVLAHVNYLLNEERLEWNEADGDGIRRLKLA